MHAQVKAVSTGIKQCKQVIDGYGYGCRDTLHACISSVGRERRPSSKPFCETRNALISSVGRERHPFLFRGVKGIFREKGKGKGEKMGKGVDRVTATFNVQLDTCRSKAAEIGVRGKNKVRGGFKRT